MKSLTALLLAIATLSWAQTGQMTARVVIHADKTFTESVQDPILRTQTEHTFAARVSELAPKVLLAKKVYMLNERLEPVHGNIYDGKDLLKARVLFLFDSFGRRTEQRMMNLSNEVYQVIRYGYDAKGKAMTPKSQTFNVASPDMRPAAIDLTQQGPNPLDRSQGDFRGNVEALPGGSVRIGADGQPMESAAPATPEEPKKKSFWQRLGLGKKE
jgi:hypothetical protein